MTDKPTSRPHVSWYGREALDIKHVDTGEAWSFGSRVRRLVADIDPARPARSSPIGNTSRYETADPRDPRVPRPVVLPVENFHVGRRGFKPAYQWEGVVEAVNGSGFRARLSPYGQANGDTSPEYAEFDYEDLADDSDLERVAEGAVFYWTVGRTRNTVGTYTNTSLVRFRRLPPVTRTQEEHARHAAQDLLADLGGD